MARMHTAMAMAIGLFCAAPSFAAEPAVSVNSEGRVVATMTIDASSADLKAVLADTTGAFAELSPDVLNVSSVRKGDCEEVTRSTRGIFRPFRFRALRCKTSNGWSEKLMESGDFTSYASDMQLVETADGVLVTYSIETEINAPVPDSMVRSNLQSAAKNLLVRLAKRVRR